MPHVVVKLYSGRSDKQKTELAEAITKAVMTTLNHSEEAGVVRVRSRTPSRASSSRMVWLSADCETPSFAAAFVKLRSRATATNATRSSKWPRCIYGIRS